MSNINTLKLTAENQEDLKVISAHIQDSIVKIVDEMPKKYKLIY